jgi:hypothetical protein
MAKYALSWPLQRPKLCHVQHYQVILSAVQVVFKTGKTRNSGELNISPLIRDVEKTTMVET